METYGEMIARLREAHGWSQDELAHQAGVPKRTIQDVELDKVKTPQRRTRQKLEMALEIEGNAEATRQSWDADVQVFLDVMGAFLSTFGADERREIMRRITINEMMHTAQRGRPNGQHS